MAARKARIGDAGRANPYVLPVGAARLAAIALNF
jgi:hypothetical protein